MRIGLHVPRASFLRAGLSGDGVILRDTMTGLRERGHDVDVMSGLDTRDVGRGDVPARRAFREALRFRRRAREVEALLVYSPSATYPDLFGWWQRRCRYVLVGADAGQPETLPRRLRPVFSAAHRRSLQSADAVGVFRPRSAERLEALGVERDRITVLPPAVDVPQEIGPQSTARAVLGLPEDAPVVVCVSRLTGRKRDGRPGKTEGVLELLRALATLPPDVLAIVVGDGRGRAEVEAERARLGLEARVRLVGSVPNELVRVYLEAADVFAYPYSLDRPWLAALEAQASAIPVVLMRTGSAESTVVDGRTGLLAGDAPEFRDQLAALLADRARARSLGEAAREYVTGHHSCDVRIGQIERLLAA